MNNNMGTSMETNKDDKDRQYCPTDNKILTLIGAWSYNGRIRTDIFLFRCIRCGTGYTGSAEEAERHQDGEEIARLEERIAAIRNKKYTPPGSLTDKTPKAL